MTFNSKFFNELSATEIYEILKGRAKIFVMEQSIQYVDMDDVDYDCLHCFFSEGNEVTAYMRAFYVDKERTTVKIGRVFTLKHGGGLGKKLMEESLKAIEERLPCDHIYVDAQTRAKGYYDKMGFIPEGEEFLEENIPHIKMNLK